MKKDLTNLVETLRGIAYDAGYALLFPVDSTTTRCYADRYNCAYRQLRAMAPGLATSIRPLPEDATAGAIRIAARAAVEHAQHVTTTRCFQRIAA